jgi:phosphoribosyl-ATP pyrophosphohydrolase/phosphoribosyl-AMP cyclohydrolase
MIVPSIDLIDGQAVQLVGGRGEPLLRRDPFEVARTFSIAGELAVIDLDAALGKGDNTDVITELVRRYPCRVGGGIRSVERARDWLDRGAEKVILGTAARPEVLSELPRERTIAALDAMDGEVVVDGWRSRTGASIEDRLKELRPYVGGFLITFVEREGRMGGTAMERVGPLVEAAGPQARITFAGGITTAEEVALLDRQGGDAQVGMALYTGRLALGDAISALLTSDRPDGLFPTLVCDEAGQSLGLAYSNAESVRTAIERQQGIYWSRKRGLWVKGASSGDTQELRRIEVDCDRDTLRFTVRQRGTGFCHLGTRDCFGAPASGLTGLLSTLAARKQDAPAGSYTAKLLSDDTLLQAKLTEEAAELAHAIAGTDRTAVVHEAADVLYFTAVALTRAGVSLAEVERELDRRRTRVRRRPGLAKSR